MRYEPHPNVVTRELDGDVVLVHLDTSRIFTLNATGSRIWALLSQQPGDHDVATLEQLLREDYEVDDERLHEDVVTLLRELEEERLVVVRTTATP
jgi:hypothetical protein